MKLYYDYMKELSADEVYCGLLGFGLFSEKIPPAFSSESFYLYCKANSPTFQNDWRPHVHYESIRNNNVPRELGIPNPMAYHQLCKCVADNWNELQAHFYEMTCNQAHIVSRIHLRKMTGTKTLFKMNYENWKTDGSPETNLLIGSKFLVHADISTCFPSMYTHSIPWALVGKDNAKTHAGPKWKKEWYNRIDKFSQNCKNGETHGLLIGPHASNLLGEIILTSIDNKLESKWRYIRHIDDYTCFVKSREEAKLFLVDLADELRRFDLSLNHKKTEIAELPMAMTKKWTRQLGNPSVLFRNGILDYIGARSYLDSAIEIMQNNNSDSAILNYAIKSLPVDTMSKNAKDYCVKTIFHLCLLYPYLLQIIDEYVFERFNVPIYQIESFTQEVYEQELKSKNYDGVCYSLFFALKYGFLINSVKAVDAVNSDSCIFRLFAFLYFKKHSIIEDRALLRDLAMKLKTNKEDFGRNWLFVYEALPKSELPIEWKQLKENGISFIKKEYQE